MSNKKYISLGVFCLGCIILFKIIDDLILPINPLHKGIVIIGDIFNCFIFLLWGKLFSDFKWREALKESGIMWEVLHVKK